MSLYILTDQEINRIVDNKNKRSIINYNMLNNEFRKFFNYESPRKTSNANEINRQNNKYLDDDFNIIDEEHKNDLIQYEEYDITDIEYQELLNKNNSNISTNDYNDILIDTENDKDFLDKVRKENEDEINLTRKLIFGLFKSSINEKASIPEKAKYVFEFATRIFDYHTPELPLEANYSTLFYRNIPKADKFIDLVVTSVGYSGDLANMITSLGKTIGLKIETLNCKFNNEMYSINKLYIGDKVTYIDAASFLEGRKKMEDCLLVSRDDLTKTNGTFTGNTNRKYTKRQIAVLSVGYRDIATVGETFKIPDTVSYDINSLVMKREKIFPPLEFYNKQKEKQI